MTTRCSTTTYRGKPKGQNPLHQFPPSKSVTSCQLATSP